MKKIITFSFALMASATMFGQTVLWNGENYDISSEGDFWPRCNREVVENPSKNGINTSDKCLKFTITGNEWNNGSAAKGLTCDAFDSKRLSLMIKKEVNSNVRVEIKCNDDMKKVVAWYDGAGEWRKLYFDFSTNNAEGTPTEITIYPTTDNVDGEQDVYIDNIQIEDAPKVGEDLLGSISDGSLGGNIKLTGAWLKGECLNADGDWKKVEYNDFGILAAKLGNNANSIDMRGTITKDVDVNGMRGDHSNVLVFADEAYSANNVVNNGKCANLVLDETKAFASPENFNAENVSITRPVYAGYNSMCLPFWVNKKDMKANNLLTYKENVEEDYQVKINFETKDAIDANVPFIAELGSDATEPLTFKNKGIVNTPASLGNTFLGTMAPMSGEGKYGLGTDNQFHKGGEKAHINAFHAYLEMPESQSAKAFVLAIDGETTGISAITNNGKSEAVKVYNLQGCQVATATSTKDLNLPAGIYIINNKKVVVK